MERPRAARRLIITADDFGRSAEINAAVRRAHQEGVLTCASLMVTGDAFDEAVAMARENPSLGVGLHLTLVGGRAASRPASIPGLVDTSGVFPANALAVGWKYFWRRSLREQIRREIRAQLERFLSTGLPLDHVNGHLHLHLHPTVLPLLLEEAQSAGVRALRATCDPFWLNLRLAGGRWVYRGIHAAIFGLLAAWAKPRLRRARMVATPRVFGLLQDGRVDESYLLRLFAAMPEGDAEVYSHPSLGAFPHELEALLSRRVRQALEAARIERLRYQDL
jgi:chitin disaccharide deacetylase